MFKFTKQERLNLLEKATDNLQKAWEILGDLAETMDNPGYYQGYLVNHLENMIESWNPNDLSLEVWRDNLNAEDEDTEQTDNTNNNLTE